MSPFRAVVAGALASARLINAVLINAVLINAVLMNTALLASAFPVRAQEPPPQEPSPIVRDIKIVGVRELSEEAVREAARVEAGIALPVSVDRADCLPGRVVNHYRDEGYTFAVVKAAFDSPSGLLTFTIDEGVIGGVEFTGVDDRLKRQF